MNWLAHALLSEDNIHYQLGNILADPLKGKPWEGANSAVANGIRMHKEIDKFTDTSKHVIDCKNIIGKSGRLRGIVIDIYFDYLLTKNWDSYSKVELNEFLTVLYVRAQKEIMDYPGPIQKHINNIIRFNVLGSYASLAGVEAALKRIDQRLSRLLLAKESTIEYLPYIEAHEEILESYFNEFFPLLIQYFMSRSSVTSREHWITN